MCGIGSPMLLAIYIVSRACSEAMRWADGLDRQGWFMVFFAALTAGYFSLRFRIEEKLLTIAAIDWIFSPLWPTGFTKCVPEAELTSPDQLKADSPIPAGLRLDFGLKLH